MEGYLWLGYLWPRSARQPPWTAARAAATRAAAAAAESHRLAELLERLRGEERQLEAAEVDLATFVRIMTTKVAPSP